MLHASPIHSHAVPFIATHHDCIPLSIPRNFVTLYLAEPLLAIFPAMRRTQIRDTASIARAQQASRLLAIVTSCDHLLPTTSTIRSHNATYPSQPQYFARPTTTCHTAYQATYYGRPYN